MSLLTKAINILNTPAPVYVKYEELKDGVYTLKQIAYVECNSSAGQKFKSVRILLQQDENVFSTFLPYRIHKNLTEETVNCLSASQATVTIQDGKPLWQVDHS